MFWGDQPIGCRDAGRAGSVSLGISRSVSGPQGKRPVPEGWESTLSLHRPRRNGLGKPLVLESKNLKVPAVGMAFVT